MEHRRFAVIGNPVDHSVSPLIHQRFASQTHLSLTYEKIKGDAALFEQQVSEFFENMGFGLNVTLPFKQRAYDLADSRTLRSQIAGAANTLWVSDNRLCADNTDGIGFLRDITRHIDLSGKELLVLGSGGAARGIISALLTTAAATITVASRTLSHAQELCFMLQATRAPEPCNSIPQLFYTDLDITGHSQTRRERLDKGFDAVINATSASLAGVNIALPEPVMQRKPFCYDLAYQQYNDTPFVQYAKNLGCDAWDGMGMLVEQAAEAFFIWNQIKPETTSLLKELRGVG